MKRIPLILACAGMSVLLCGQSPTPFPQTLPANTIVGRLGAGVPGPAEAIPISVLATQVFSDALTVLNIGIAGNMTGVLGLQGITSGKVSITTDPAAGTYNFILPNTPGTAGQCLVSQGGSVTMTWGACSAAGAVTSVGLTMPGVFTVNNSPVTTSGTLAVTALGTSGGIPYFSAATTMASSGALTVNLPVIGGGAGASPTVGTVTGNTTKFATFNGAATNGNCVSIDANGNLQAAAGACSTGGSGTVNSGLINQLAWYAAGGTAVSGLATAANGILITSAGSVPSIGSTIPTAVQANITGTGTLTSGATGGGFTVALTTSTVSGLLLGVNGGTGVANTGKTITLGGNLTTSGAFATTLTVSNTTNSTLPAGTHTLAGLDVAQTFTALNGFTSVQLSAGLIYPVADSTTAIQITKADGVTGVVDVDTTNARVGINRTPGAFDLDINNAARVGGALTFGVGTITGLTANNSPDPANDFALYWDHTANAIRKCTIGACGAAGASGVTSLNGLTGGVSINAGTGILVTPSAPNVSVAIDVATQSNMFTATSNKFVEAGTLFNSAGAMIALSGTSSVTPDFSTGFNFSFTATTATNYTLNNPTNVKVGQTGCIFLAQPGAGSVAVITYGTNWKFSGPTKTPLTATLSAVDMLCYIARTTTFISASMSSNVQ